MQELEKFREMFWDAFHRPKLESQNFVNLWSSLEPVNEMLAGPLYSIYSNGNCNYIFEDKVRFPAMNVAEDFLKYCDRHIQSYHSAITEMNASNEVEKNDKKILLYQTDIKIRLAKLAFEILKKC